MSKETSSSSSSGGIGFVGLLTILFVALKLTGYIDWPWLWVVSPIWIAALIGIAFVVSFFGGAVVVIAIQDTLRKRRQLKAKRANEAAFEARRVETAKQVNR